MLTSLEATRVSKKRKAMEQLIHSQKFKAPGRKSQKLTDKITALQEIVPPYGKVNLDPNMEPCLHFKSIGFSSYAFLYSGEFGPKHGTLPSLQIEIAMDGNMTSRGTNYFS